MPAAAVVQTSFLGDMVLTTPLLARLAREGPVHVVATPANAPLLEGHPAVATVLVYDKRGADRGWGGLWRTARALRALGASRALLAQGSLRSAALTRLAGIPERVGFDRSAGRPLYTRRIGYRADLHHAQRLWQLGDPLGADVPPPAVRPTLHPGVAHAAAADALLAALSPGAAPVALAPGSAWGTKRWPGFAALASAMATADGWRHVPLVVIGGGADAPLAAAITAARPPGSAPVLDATGRLPLLATAALLARCTALVTNDSLPLHLASAMETPTVALFGPTVPALGFGPLAPASRVVEHPNLPCRPCHAHGPATCPLRHFRCMGELSVPQVLGALHAVTRGAP
ncbi:MAG: glycosyltransferase family 9 protein [Gemmatimonadetes bacterium]|nr:glycosyltransferase family 9 protein [Gemmatimonadota bacterium]